MKIHAFNVKSVEDVTKFAQNFQPIVDDVIIKYKGCEWKQMHHSWGVFKKLYDNVFIILLIDNEDPGDYILLVDEIDSMIECKRKMIDMYAKSWKINDS